jgi:hypothetical protein
MTQIAASTSLYGLGTAKKAGSVRGGGCEVRGKTKGKMI